MSHPVSIAALAALLALASPLAAKSDAGHGHGEMTAPMGGHAGSHEG